MTALIMRFRRLLTAFRDDTSGVMLPYVTIMLVVFIGLGALALDGGRYMSMQTQMQAVADGLAIAGARELNQRSGARARAATAIDNLVSNGLTGMGYSGAIIHAAPVFYSALAPATAGFTAGTPATSDLDAKFVAVTVNPVTVPTIMPITFFQSAGVNSISTGARAIAGFLGRAVCDMPPVFICNPYETAGMSDSQGTEALRTAMEDGVTPKRMLQMTMDKTTPGHFGYLVPPDACNGAACLKDWIARTHPPACYQTPGVDLNTGNKAAVSDAFNVRFDMYSGSLSYSADYAPDVNVRKGFLPGGGGNWCNPTVPKPYYKTLPSYTQPPIINTTGTTTTSGSNTEKKTITAMPPADVSNAFNPATVSGNPDLQMVSGATIQPGTDIKGLGSTTGTSLEMSNVAATDGTNVPLTIKWKTSGFPHDKNWTSICTDGACIQGDGDWDCLNYWKLNHTATEPPGCTSSNPSLSRYEVYQYEIANNLVDDWSGNGNPNTGGSSTGNGESGAPYCAGPGNGVAKRRIIHAAIINCLAHADLITGGATANNIPVADFGKFFMTQPVDATGIDGILYGEMSGLVGSLDEVRIMNQVQLYR